MKKLIALLICVMVLFCGCDSYRAFMSIENSTAKSWRQSHDYLDGRKSHTLRLGTKAQDMVIEVVTEKGEIDIIVTDSFGNTVFEIDDAETGKYAFTARGKIKIRVEADEHSGSFSVEKAG
ncbi:MAG: hypothetical protein IJ306_06320 [Oscillospiraceae bacterium]|nr:hypothetical protein [Oscillospiraceae bacterium]